MTTTPRAEVEAIADALANLDTVLSRQIARVLADCDALGVDPYGARTPAGDYLLAPLLTARAQVLVALLQHGLLT